MNPASICRVTRGMRFSIFPLMALCACACSGDAQVKADLTPKTAMTLTITSTAFTSGGTIALANSGYGTNVSPPLTWTTVPPKTRSVVLIVDDPDSLGGTFTHWVLYNLGAETNSLPAGLPKTGTLNALGSAMQGKNGTGSLGYFGPRPPAGKPHHYHFKLYAVDQIVGLQPGATKNQVLASISGHILASGELIGLYQKR